MRAYGDIMFSLIWSFGIMVDERHRKTFQEKFREKVFGSLDSLEERDRMVMSDEAEIYDFYFNN